MDIFTVRNSSCGKVMFSQASVILSTGGGCAWQRGTYMAKGTCIAKRGGACVVKEVCVAKGGMLGEGGMCVEGGHAWQGLCVAGETATAVDGMHPTGMHSCCIYFLNFDFRCWFVACLFVCCCCFCSVEINFVRQCINTTNRRCQQTTSDLVVMNYFCVCVLHIRFYSITIY